MGAIAWALNTMREKGLVRTAKVATSVVSDLAFDWRCGTDTTRFRLFPSRWLVGVGRLPGKRVSH